MLNFQHWIERQCTDHEINQMQKIWSSQRYYAPHPPSRKNQSCNTIGGTRLGEINEHKTGESWFLCDSNGKKKNF